MKHPETKKQNETEAADKAKAEAKQAEANREDQRQKEPAKRYDPIQERAPDRNVTKADKKPLSRRDEINKQMQENKDWIAKHQDDREGVQKREAANAELTHRLIDLDVAGQDANRKAEQLSE